MCWFMVGMSDPCVYFPFGQLWQDLCPFLGMVGMPVLEGCSVFAQPPGTGLEFTSGSLTSSFLLGKSLSPHSDCSNPERHGYLSEGSMQVSDQS